MPVADLGACEWFVMELRRSGLIERGQLEQVVSDFLRKQPRAEAKALADSLVAQKILTAFQADRVMTGKAQGLVLGPYTLLDAIGSGSMGTVYKSLSKNDGQNFAVKVLPRRSMWNVRLARRQVRSFGQFTHPSVVPFVDVGTSGGMHYLAWPLVDGESLEAVVQREGKLAPDVATLFALQVGQGLAVAAQNGLFHGLLKPSNILIGTDRVARILDFGIGSLLVENEGESLVDTMSTANTLTSGLDCASPESIMEPTNRTPSGDQYSLGCVLYYCLTGRYPFPDGSAVEKMMAHQSKDPEPIRQLNPAVPAELAAVVERLMAKDPAARYGVTEEAVEALTPFAAESSRVPSLGRSANNSFTETPRPKGGTLLAQPAVNPHALRQAFNNQRKSAHSGSHPRPATAPAANLPPGVRMPLRPGDVAPASARHPQPKPTPRQFGPFTLALGGLAIMCLTYFALTYFQVVR